MFVNLSVKNFAIIEDASISFKDGLTVLTGETGAGKSLIIDSINLLLGDRANSELIRNGEDKAVIKGTFIFSNKRLKGLLDKLDIDYIDNKLEIVRTISSSKNVVKINDKVVTLAELKSISKYLADIHQQFDMIKLLNKDNYLEIIDGFKYDIVESYKFEYLSTLNSLKEGNDKYQKLLDKITNIKLERENYEFILKELNELNLSLNEEEEIDSEISLLKNYDKIYDLLLNTKEIIDKESLIDLYTIKVNIKKLSEYQDEYNDIYEKLNDHYYELEALFEELLNKFKHLDYDPNRLDELEIRKQEINRIKKKYHKNVQELLEYQQELKELLKDDADLDIELNKEKENLKSLYLETYNKALDLSKIRSENAKYIEKELMNNLKDLGLSSIFKIIINERKYDDSYSLDIFTEEGINDADFYIETNIGEGLKPLAKIASGGEISRIMLAFKALYIKSQKVDTVIFDEVDTGISGEIARKVAFKIKEISLSSQVIIITHLPQVASLSTNHIKITKEVKNDRTYTTIKELNLEEKIYEIALMISDGHVTNSQLEYAKEMIMNNK